MWLDRAPPPRLPRPSISPTPPSPAPPSPPRPGRSPSSAPSRPAPPPAASPRPSQRRDPARAFLGGVRLFGVILLPRLILLPRGRRSFPPPTPFSSPPSPSSSPSPPNIICTRTTLASGASAHFSTASSTSSRVTSGLRIATTCPPFPAPQMWLPSASGANAAYNPSTPGDETAGQIFAWSALCFSSAPANVASAPRASSLPPPANGSRRDSPERRSGSLESASLESSSPTPRPPREHAPSASSASAIARPSAAHSQASPPSRGRGAATRPRRT